MKPAIMFLLFVFLLFGCKSEEERIQSTQKQGETNVLPPKTEQQQPSLEKQGNIDPKIAVEIIAVIKENIAATEAKDKDRVMKTIHKDCPQRKSTMQGMDYVFANFDMSFNLEKVEVLEVSTEDARVYYMQTTRAIRGEGFAPTRATGIHHMKKENGEWKIFQTEYLNNEQIN